MVIAVLDTLFRLMLISFGVKNWQDMLKTTNKVDGYEPNKFVKFWRSYGFVLLVLMSPILGLHCHAIQTQ